MKRNNCTSWAWVTFGFALMTFVRVGLVDAEEAERDAACESCHPAIYESFGRSEMGRSFYRPGDAPVIESYDSVRVHDMKRDLYYEPIRNGDEWFQREFRLDGDDKVVYAQEHRADYVVGSGNHNRTYLSDRDGILRELPLTWYTDAGIWDLSPGYDEENLRFSRPIVPECMNCHNSYADYEPFRQGSYTNIPHGIGCERCHGPGEAHIAHYEGTDESDLSVSTIVNPAKLTADRQTDVCLQCHLQGTMSVLKEERAENSFRPGMKVSDVRSIYLPAGDETGSFGIASHGERMMASACYIRSEGRLTCTTCHNPHEPLNATTQKSYNDACLDCHQVDSLTELPEHRADQDCVACHMRQGETSNIIHVNFTDHWIRSKTISEGLSFQEARDEKRGQLLSLESYFEESDEAAEIRLGIAYVKYYEAKHSHPAYLKRAITNLSAGLSTHSEHHEGRYHLGLAFRHVGRLEDAAEQLEHAGRLEPADGRVWFQLGRVLQELGRDREAVSAYKTAVQANPQDVVAFNNLGNALGKLGKLREAAAAYAEAIRSQKDYAPAYNNLGDHYAFKLNDFESGQAYFEAALKYDPDFVVALHNLGTVLMGRGSSREAEKRFERALELDPAFLPAMGNLVSIYLDDGRREEARTIVGKMRGLAPRDDRVFELERKVEAAR